MIDNIITFAYLIIILLVGVYAGRKVKSIEDFSVAGRKFSYLIVFATLSASFIGGGFSMGNAEKVFLFGIANVFALWGFSLKEILVAQFIAPKMGKYSNAISVGDIMGQHYGKFAQVITGILSVVVCGGIMGAQVGAMGYIFNVFMGLDIIYGIIIGCGIVIAYSTIGGMRAIIFTDVIQFVVLSIGLPAVLIFGIIKAGGVSVVLNAVPATHLSLLGPHTIIAFLSLFITFVIGETLVPPYVQRLLISEPSEIKKGTMLSGLFSIPFFLITGGIGLVALILFPDIDANLAMPIMIKNVLPPVMTGIVVAGVISIVMSSADSFLNAASVAVVQDIIRPLSSKKKQPVILIQIINLFVGLIAIIFAIKIKSVLDILLYSYNFWSPVVLVPLLAAILGIKVRKELFVWGMLGGIIGLITWNFIVGSPFGIDGLIIGVISNGVFFLIAYFLDKKKN